MTEVLDAYSAAITYLSMREYASKELMQKLAAKGWPVHVVSEVIETLKAEGLQSDERFAEHFVRYRISKGQGPVRMKRELQERGINSSLIREVLENSDICWDNELAKVMKKRFKAKPRDYREWQKQARWLQYRGFSVEQIRRGLKADYSVEDC